MICYTNDTPMKRNQDLINFSERLLGLLAISVSWCCPMMTNLLEKQLKELEKEFEELRKF